MGDALDELLALLELEALEVNLFRGLSPHEDRQRVFGGQVAAQALVAAGRTVGEDRPVHSLHAYFLRPGDPNIPIVYDVDRIRDGKSFTTRRVVAIQHGRAIFNLAASFQIVENGPDHQMPMPTVPGPDELPTWQQRVEPYLERLGPDLAQWLVRERPIDSRPVDDPRWLDPSPREPQQDVWIKSNGDLPEGVPLIHECVVAYASDLTLLDTAMFPHAISYQEQQYMIASLDHAMWFHRPFRADEWLLYSQTSPSASGGRGLAYGGIFRQDGALAVSVVQEGLIRPVDPARLSPAIAFASAKGLLAFPVNGSKIRDFGGSDGAGGLEKGISLAARAGAQVTTPCDGWVVYAGPFRSYGQLLILNAGGGYHVLIAGMDRISVNIGQFVLTGEPVATMGKTSQVASILATNASQPVLYVEFRKDGTPIDPGPWWAANEGEKVRG